VLVTARYDPSLQDTLMRLRQYRRNILLYKAGGEPPEALPGIRAVHLPFTEPEDG